MFLCMPTGNSWFLILKSAIIELDKALNGMFIQILSFFFGTGRDFTKQFACKTEKDFSFSIFIYKILKKKKKD